MFYPIPCFYAHRIVFLGTLPCKFGVVSVSYFILCICLSLHRIQYFGTWPCNFFHFVRFVFDSLPLFPLYIFNFVLRYPVSLICVRFVFCHLLLPLHASCLIRCPVCVRLLYSVYLPLRKLHLHAQRYPTLLSWHLTNEVYDFAYPFTCFIKKKFHAIHLWWSK